MKITKMAKVTTTRNAPERDEKSEKIEKTEESERFRESRQPGKAGSERKEEREDRTVVREGSPGREPNGEFYDADRVFEGPRWRRVVGRESRDSDAPSAGFGREVIQRFDAGRNEKMNFSRTSSGKSQKIFHEEKNFAKFERSLKSLGFEPSDFGIFPKNAAGRSGRKVGRPLSGFSAKTSCVCSDRPSAIAGEVRSNACSGVCHRKSLARAAYEEWYLRKEEETWRKREEERKEKLKETEISKRESERRKKIAEEEYEKWIRKKRPKKKSEDEGPPESPSDRMKKSKQDSEYAFLQWKRKKDEESRKKKKDSSKEEEKKAEMERLKQRKRELAEKAFASWKNNLEFRSEKFQMEKRNKRQRRKEEMERLKLREEQSKKCFGIWKAMKEEQIKERAKELRYATKLAREERMVREEERTYEAEQAFEEWLNKVCSRKRSTRETPRKLVPWLPT